jgi:hypothetical protein
MRRIFNMKHKSLYSAVAVALLTASVTGCGGSDSKDDVDTNDTQNTVVNLTGQVSAPGGQVAFNQPSVLKRFFASILGSSANAAITGVAPVGAGVTVNLIEVDADGEQVGDVIASGTTDATGAFSIDAPESFTPGSQYVVRAAGSSTDLDARVTDLTPDVDPLTDVASDIITDSVDDLSLLSVSEAEEIYTAVDNVSQDVDPTGLSTTELLTALRDEANTNEDVANVVGSTTSSGQICGTVKDSDGTALENIRIVVRDYGNWVTRAKTKTDADGAYCVNVPIKDDVDPYISERTLSGEYILGALNYTGTSMAASQWWTSNSNTAADGSGGANSQFGADKISVADTTTVTKDFFLNANGARIQGTVTNSDGGAIEGMSVLIRNYDTFKPLTAARVKADGTYRVDVKEGDYLISFRNKTRQPYASEIYREGTDGVNNRNMASRETMTGGMTRTYNAVLEPGVVISGVVTTDSGVAVPGQVVSIDNNDGGRLERLRTNKAGKFRIMVNPRLDYVGVPYSVRTRGQAQDADTNGADDNTKTGFKLSQGTGLTFNAPVAEIKGKLVSAADGTTPVGKAVLMLRGAIGSDFGNYQMRALEVSNADGTFSIYTDTLSDYILQLRMDSDENYGSGNYDGSNMSNTAFNAASTSSPIQVTTSAQIIDLGTIPVPTLGQGNGVGYLDGNGGEGAATIHICNTGTAPCNGTKRLVSSAARGDGSFKITLPAGTYPVVRAVGSDSSFDCTTSVTILDGKTSSITFDLSTPECTVTNASP